jgi:hypothetical protein
MSRTFKDIPYKHLKNKKDQKWRFEVGGFPGAWGGAWNGIGQYTNLHERSERRRVRDELNKGKDPGGYKHKHRAKWDAW